MKDYVKMSKAALIQRLREVEPLDSERPLAEAEEQVHLIRGVVERGSSAGLIANADLPDPRIVYINPAFAKVTGYSMERDLGRPLSSLSAEKDPAGGAVVTCSVPAGVVKDSG